MAGLLFPEFLPETVDEIFFFFIFRFDACPGIRTRALRPTLPIRLGRFHNIQHCNDQLHK